MDDTTTPRRSTDAAATAAAPPGRGWSPGTSAVLGLAVPAVAGLVSAGLTPRGPLTAPEVLLSMLAALVVGVLSGALLRSRWALLVAPVLFVVVFEVARTGTSGATVDTVRLDSVLGVLALVAGRGVHGLLVLAPMVLGSRYGVEVAARRGIGGPPRMGRWGWAGTSLAAVALLLLAALVARPGSTAPVVDAAGDPVEGSIAELVSVPVGDTEQTLMIRGSSTEDPVLLHLAGGPGGTDLGAMRLDPSLEDDFVVVTWDQPGTGKSYPALDPTEDMTLQRVVDDTLAVTDYLRTRFEEDQVVLTGQSWGTVLGVLAVQQRPEHYRALVSTGQMVDIRETDEIFYEETSQWARTTGDASLATDLLEQGPPPYEDMLDYTTLVAAERDIYAYPEFDGSTEMPATIWGPENTFMDRVNAARGLLDTYSLLYPQLQELDFREDVPRLEVPVYVVMGEHEARGRVDPAREWFEQLQAPDKTWIEVPAASHRASFEQPEAYARLMQQVLTDTAGSG
ncbi:alpha/beta fold hydrolase [Aquipuribacter sp. MA13-6]|uniref:alpha/beta fold hydrolase n=1 Tax=unclassified Aquipuribacter TaxID=2635084 RepID=UPI003EEDC74D